VGDKALLESNPSTATTYTGQRRLNRRLFLFSVQVVKSDKLQPASGGLIKTAKNLNQSVIQTERKKP